MKIYFIGIVIFLGLIIACSVSKRWSYPEAKKENIVENYHGTMVADPYRWLENPDAPETIKWVEAENKLTKNFINKIKVRKKIEERLTELWNFPKYGIPIKRGTRYFFSKNDGLQNQDIIYMQESLDGEAKIVIDPNKFSEDGTIALSGRTFSENGRYMSYALSKSGSDQQEIFIHDIDTGIDFDEKLKWCKFSNMAWTHNHKGFYYNRFPNPETVPKEDRNKYSKIFYHKIGTPQSDDILVYEDPNHKEWLFYPFLSEDGKYLFLHISKGTDTENRIYYRKENSSDDFIKLLDKADAYYGFIDNQGPYFYFQTNLNAPRYKIIAIDIRNPEPQNWKEIIPQQDDVIQFATVVNNQLLVGYLHNAHHKLKIYNMDGSFDREIEFPEIGSITAIGGRKVDTEMFIGYTSFLFPTRIYRYDFKTDELSIFRDSKINFDASKYETKQIFYKSKDGTRIPMFITHKKGLKLNGNNPTLLYAYGGFNISITPNFAVKNLIWIENGGVYASANLRGGGEYGEKWHKAGMLENKQNVFDDFISAAEWLIENGYTSTSKLAIDGASNGGLLTAACLIQKPDLYGAVISRVPVIDMLRYHKFTVGHFWTGEYGNAEKNPEHFNFMYKYSPLHNVKEGVTYPPTLITTADTDDRVAPAHAKKFAATLQEKDSGKNPILIRIETKAGHGAGKPTSKIIEEIADVYAFLFKILNISE